MHMYEWIMEEHQPITFSQAGFAQNYIIHRLIDWNSRMSSFEERTDVGEWNDKLRFN